MYSRKFGGIGPIPPDYGGVAARMGDRGEDNDRDIPEKPEYEELPGSSPTREGPPRKDSPPKPFSGKFSFEDILIAGLLLSLLGDGNCDNGTLMILGFLLVLGDR